MKKQPEFHGVIHGYTRKSTTDDRQENSHELQRADIQRWAGGRHVEWHRENGSARRGRKRPVLAALLDALRPGDMLVVSRMSRLARSVIDGGHVLERAQREGWNLVVLDLNVNLADANGRFAANNLLAAAQWQSEVQGELIAEALAKVRAEGKHVGRPRAIPRPVRKRILAEYAEAGSVRAVAAALNAARVPTVKTGGRWWPETVTKVLRQEGVA